MAKNTPSDKLKALYDAAPYPEVLADKMPTQAPLLLHWVNAALAFDKPVLYAQSKILVAGCGSGAEAFLLAKQFPQAQIVGVDFSAASIAKAQEQAVTLEQNNVTFEVADLTTDDWCAKYTSFDFISCHGVADFVADPTAFLKTMTTCLAPNGVLCMTVNSPYHPAGRLKAAFETLGISPNLFQDTPEQRQLLQLALGLMGKVGIEGIGNAPKAYLDIDIFPPIAHHFSMETWSNLAKEVGLNFCGSTDAFLGIAALSDNDLPLLYPLGKPALSRWMASLTQHAGMQLLFSKHLVQEPDFTQENLLDWRPHLATFVGTIPPLKDAPDTPRPITLSFPGIPNLVIHSTAYDLEVLRLCDGSRSIDEILQLIPMEGNWEGLKACLFRAYHFGLLLI